MSVLLTIVILLVVLGTVFAFARIYVRKATRGSATQAANLFTSYPETNPAPDEENVAAPRVIGAKPSHPNG
jgi:hypothetical protein